MLTTSVSPIPVWTEQNDAKEADDAKAASAASNDETDVKGTGSDSGLEFIDDLPKLIDGMQKNYVDVYVQAMQKYTDLMGRLAKLKTIISNSVKDVDSKYVKIDVDAIMLELNSIITDFESMNNALFVSQGTGDAGYDECLRWCTELGLNPANVLKTDSATGKSYILADLSPLYGIKDGLKDVKQNVDVLLTLWQARTASMDIHTQTCNTSVNKCAEKYSAANANLDSLMKMVANILAELQRIIAQMLS